MIEVSKTNLEGVLLIKPKIFEDFRGQYVESYNEDLYLRNGITVKFVEDDFSVSTKNVLRGIHSDSEAWKLVSCLYGKFYLVIVNCDTDSKEFGKWQSFDLSDANRMQVLVPPKHGVAHLILSDKAIFNYKQSKYYDPKRQTTYVWNDQKLKIEWPVKNPILSERDKLGHYA
jgi:dTDP-4-dehydrorhamnose 3,5-epimerase